MRVCRGERREERDSDKASLTESVACAVDERTVRWYTKRGEERKERRERVSERDRRDLLAHELSCSMKGVGHYVMDEWNRE